MTPLPSPSKLSVAIVEGDLDLLEELSAKLADYGFNVIGCPSAKTFWVALAHTSFDIMVLDLALPKESGLTTLEQLRRADPHIGIIVLTDTHAGSEHSAAFLAGADACLVKAVAIQVLGAAIESVARRIAPQQRIRWAISEDGWTLQCPSGAVIELNMHERVLLGSLVRNAGAVVPTAELLIEMYGAETGRSGLARLNATLHRLRKRVGALGEALPVRRVYRGGLVFDPNPSKAR